MKINHLLYAMSTLVALTACSSTFEEPLSDDVQKSISERPISRALDNDSISEDSILMEPTEEMLRLKDVLNSLRGNELTKATNYDSYIYDEYYDSNIMAIEGLPLYIRVRQAATSSSAIRVYMSIDGAGKEINMRRAQEIDDRFRFYLKKPLSVTGIPYMIYSYKTNTPLAVSAYSNNPNKRVLMVSKTEPDDYFPCSWDLIPADSTGCFYIQSQSYIGQSDPNNFASIFYYVLEAQDDNRSRYAKRVAGSPQQIYYFELNNTFSVDSVIYDFDNATVTPSTPVSAQTINLSNSTEFKKQMPFTANVTCYERSRFIQQKNRFLFKIKEDKLLPRPYTQARRAMINPNTPRDAKYLSSTPHPKNLTFSNQVDVEARSVCQVTVKFKAFNLSVPYVITAKYNNKVIKLKGKWEGYVMGIPDSDKPDVETKNYDLDTGEEIFRLYSFDTQSNRYIITETR